MIRDTGFGMIELLAVLAIVGILASIAYPSYTESVRKGQRQDAVVGLTSLAQRMERCYTEFNRYNHASCPVTFPQPTPDGRYTVTAVTANNSFTLTASPAPGRGMENDTRCTSFTLTHTGARNATGTHPQACW